MAPCFRKVEHPLFGKMDLYAHAYSNRFSNFEIYRREADRLLNFWRSYCSLILDLPISSRLFSRSFVVATLKIISYKRFALAIYNVCSLSNNHSFHSFLFSLPLPSFCFSTFIAMSTIDIHRSVLLSLVLLINIAPLEREFNTFQHPVKMFLNWSDTEAGPAVKNL